ncbi:MAG TPA: hypothetical protein VLB86_00875 [Gaiellaceae bacterium]|nr:hypothetical protein [Gaiellaceae bacterium]
MKKLLGVAALLVALAALAVASAAADTGGSDRPFTGTLVGSATWLPDGSCPPVGLRTWSEGSGTASHLGLVGMSSNHCTPPGDVISGEMTFFAANGDEVHMTYSGTCGPLPPVGGTITCTVENVIVGGTGRFANATGEADVTGHVTWLGFGVPVMPARWTWDGTISY